MNRNINFYIRITYIKIKEEKNNNDNNNVDTLF